MSLASGGTTNLSLLHRGRDWRDHPAWVELFALYGPMLAAWCQKVGLGSDDRDEVIQRVWVELARRLPTFEYDPSQRFRGWLWCLCRSQAVGFLRERGRRGELTLEADLAENRAGDELDDSPSAKRAALCSIAQQVQTEVQSKVDPGSWRAFELVAINGLSVREAAETLGKSYAATFACQSRVKQRLREVGTRLLHDAGLAAE